MASRCRMLISDGPMLFFWSHEVLSILLKQHSDLLCSLQGLGHGLVEASSFRTSYVPLNKQEDFIKGMQACLYHAWLACTC